MLKEYIKLVDSMKKINIRNEIKEKYNIIFQNKNDINEKELFDSLFLKVQEHLSDNKIAMNVNMINGRNDNLSCEERAKLDVEMQYLYKKDVLLKEEYHYLKSLMQ